MKHVFFAGVLALIATISIASSSSRADAKRLARVSLLAFNELGCPNRALEEGLRELRYVEGQNIKLECRHAHGKYADLDRIANELVRTRPDVIVTIGHAQSQAAKRATHDIPIAASPWPQAWLPVLRIRART